MAEKNTLKQQIKEELIEDFGKFMEADSKVPPLAARMLAHLIIDNHKGITFEEMVDLLKASKSSVFTTLNILLHKGRFIYYTVPGDRKTRSKESRDGKESVSTCSSRWLQ